LKNLPFLQVLWKVFKFEKLKAINLKIKIDKKIGKQQDTKYRESERLHIKIYIGSDKKLS